MFMPSTLIQIVAAGGSLSIDASKYTPSTLIQIAAVAARSEAKVITLKNCSALMTSTLIQIALAGKGKVVFDIDI